MIAEIFAKNKFMIILTYILLAIEEGMMSAVPYCLGLAVDSLLENQYHCFWYYVGICSVSLLISVGRRLWDTRMYSHIWAKAADEKISHLIEQNIERSKVVSRFGLLIDYTRFFEYAVPAGIAAIIDIVISIIILFLFNPTATIILIVILKLTIIVQYMGAKITSNLHQDLQVTTEKNNADIISSERPNLSEALAKQSNLLISISDTEATIYGLHETLAIIAEIVMLLVSINTGATAGTILANLTYVFRIFMKLSQIGNTIAHYKIVRGYEDFFYLKSGQD